MISTLGWILASAVVAVLGNILIQLLHQEKSEPPRAIHWIPLVGNAIQYGTNPTKFFAECRAKYGDIFTFTLFGKQITCFLSVDGNDFVLNGKHADLNAEDIYKPLTKPVFGSDVVYDCPNAKFMEQKRFIKFGLTRKAFESYVPMIEAEVLGYLAAEPSLLGDTGTMDVPRCMAGITILTAARTLQGKEVRGKLSAEFAELYHDLDLGFRPVNLLFPWAPLPENRKRDAAHAKMREVYSAIIDERRRSEKECDSDMIWNLMNCTYKDGSAVPNHEIAHLMITLLMAGQHTSSSASSWVVLHLASRPEVTEELFQEQVQVLGQGSNTPSLQYSDLEKLPLLQQVIKETLRVHSSIHSVMRKATRAIRVPQTDYIVPPGRILLASPQATARDEQYFSNADEWQPHRWSSDLDDSIFDAEETAGISRGAKSAYLPFGAGRHRCIGEQFAYLNLGAITDVLLTHRETESGTSPSDFVASEEFLASHVLRIPPPGAKDSGQNLREVRGKAKQFSTLNGRSVLVKDASVYSNKGFRTLAQAQIQSDATWYPDVFEARQWLLYYVTKPLVGTWREIACPPAILPPSPQTAETKQSVNGDSAEYSTPRKKDIKTFHDLLNNFPMIARQMQPGLEEIFTEFTVVFQKPLPAPPSAADIPDPAPDGPIATAMKRARSNSFNMRSQYESTTNPLPVTEDFYAEDEEDVMRASLETAVTTAIDLFQGVDKQQLSLLGATTDLTGPLVEKLIERYITENVHHLLFPRLISLKRPEDLELEAKIRQMEYIDISQVGIAIDGGPKAKHDLIISLGPAVEEFRKISSSMSPQEMLELLLSTMKSISQLTGRANDEGQDQPGEKAIMTVNADTLLSLLLYVVIRSGARNLQARLVYIRNFIFVEDVDHGELGYALNTFDAALHYLSTDSSGLRRASRKNRALWEATKNGSMSDLKKIMEPNTSAIEDDDECELPSQKSSRRQSFIRSHANGSARHPSAILATADRLSRGSGLSHVFPFQTDGECDGDDRHSVTFRVTKVKKVSMDTRSFSSDSEFSFHSRSTSAGTIGSALEGDISVERLAQTSDSFGESVLMMAVQHGQLNILKYLLSLGGYYPLVSVLEDMNNEDTSLLSAAVQQGNAEIIDTLLDRISSGVSHEQLVQYVQRQDIWGRSIGHYLFNSPALITRIGYLIPWKQRDKNGQTPLFALCRSYDHTDYYNMVEAGLEAAKVAQRDGQPLHVDEHVDGKGNTLLHIINDPRLALRILRFCDVDVNATNEKRFTPLMLASKYGRYDMVRSLFADPRVDLGAREARGLTAVELAKDEDVRNKIDDLGLFSMPPSPDGRITGVVRAFFVEDGTVRLVLKSAAPTDHDSYTVTTSRRSLSDFEQLGRLLAEENPASWVPTVTDTRSPFQLPSKPSRSLLRDIQAKMDWFLRTMLDHPTLAKHEMLWEFFLVPELQLGTMEERTRLKIQARIERIKEEYEPVQDLKEVEQFVNHAREMWGFRRPNYFSTTVTTPTNNFHLTLVYLVKPLDNGVKAQVRQRARSSHGQGLPARSLLINRRTLPRHQLGTSNGRLHIASYVHPTGSGFDDTMTNAKRADIHAAAPSPDPAQSTPTPLTGSTCPGVLRMELVARHLTLTTRAVLLGGIFVVAYVYSLDVTLRYAYQPTATDSFRTHSLLAAVAVLRSVVAAAAQPAAAKAADVFGRAELLLASVVLYVVGTVVDATARGVEAFAAGAVLYQLGFTGASFLVEVVLSDVTSLRARLLASYIPVSPFLINAWVAGDVAAAALASVGWRVGIGMWAVIFPVSTLPLLGALWWAGRRAGAEMRSDRAPFRQLGAAGLGRALFWQLDVVGVVLLVAALSLVLVPLTLAGGTEASWHRPHIIAPLVVGVLCVPALIAWESKARRPMMPPHLLKDRTVWGALGVIASMNCAAAVQGDYLYTVLVISFNQSVLSATRITSLYSFVACITGLLFGAAAYKIRRLKWIIVTGTCLHLVAFGLLIQFRGGSGANYSGMVGAQVLLGASCGLFTYAALTSIQAATRHEHLAVITGVYFACFNVGGAIGNAISGAIWTQLLPGELSRQLATFGNETLSGMVYDAPFTTIEEYPWGTAVREAVVAAYRQTQKILSITGIGIAVLVVLCALVLRDPRLGDEQSLPNAEIYDRSRERNIRPPWSNESWKRRPDETFQRAWAETKPIRDVSSKRPEFGVGVVYSKIIVSVAWIICTAWSVQCAVHVASARGECTVALERDTPFFPQREGVAWLETCPSLERWRWARGDERISVQETYAPAIVHNAEAEAE
ncbi:VPS9 domain protein [Cordyceps fumosorosea ARSEF 2679]|uniref:VPS9 domain protein n=1 Tax=Cordyceps fumosorosea (strain ARSEF 2679) TaxID=1081104 RepID=A0A167LGC5_CORFA|nr:VPS9 domain protein [Cordyceps fumosorosea ARSEF 2679]OAA53059.1 VPS9 domain protein [Cordyceps fumosorosea ARSEF 2679]